jgi:hydrogenase expression/formation protein HypE
MNDTITLAHGAGGREMDELIRSLGIVHRGLWKSVDDDSAVLPISGNQLLCFTTDSFIVTPLFFPGGDIGHLAVCGTINDLAVMGAAPLGLSLSFVIEEGFPKKDLLRIMDSIKRVSEETGVPIVTGDTKVMEQGKLDKLIINTAGVGILKEKDLLTREIAIGDKVIISGGLGEHAVALLSKRFDYETSIVSDAKPLMKEITAVQDSIKVAKDITRGGLAAIANELCGRHKVGMLLSEEKIPAKKEVVTVTKMLGINIYDLACEGRFLCIAPASKAAEVEKALKGFNRDACIIGEIFADDKVVLQTQLGKRILPAPLGRIVPRIC